MREVSIIIPVKNEASSIEALLQGLFAQTHLPAEIVITDGGSTDRTTELIRAWQKQSPLPVTLIETAQALPGRGRNMAIRQARCEWLACIDAGIAPAHDWLEKLVETSEQNPQARVIFGRCQAAITSYFTECAAMTYMPPPNTPSAFYCFFASASLGLGGSRGIPRKPSLGGRPAVFQSAGAERHRLRLERRCASHLGITGLTGQHLSPFCCVFAQ